MENKKFIPGKSWVDVSGAVITDYDKDFLHEVVERGWYTEGRYCRAFEDRLREFSGKKHIQLVNSGSSASLVAMASALRFFDPKYEKPYVLTCATAFPTTVAPIYQSGRIPIYVDIIPYTLEPDYSQIATITKVSKFRKSIVGAIFTHTLGFPFEEEWIKNEMLPEECFLISDCCDALGTVTLRAIADNEYPPVGYYADLSTYSFFPAHHITSGEGGAVITNNPDLAELTRCYSNWGRSCYCQPGQANTCGKRFDWDDRGLLPEGWDHKYIFSEVGYNLKMTEFQGALGYSQSLRLMEMNIERKRHYTYLLNYFQNSKFFDFIELSENIAPFGFPILRNEDAPFSTKDFVDFLESRKIRTRRVFAGNIIKQPAFMNLPYEAPYGCAGSDRVMNDMIWIGCHPALTYQMLDYVIENVKEFIKDK